MWREGKREIERRETHASAKLGRVFWDAPTTREFLAVACVVREEKEVPALPAARTMTKLG